jgi:hypothetical protein
MTHFFILSFLMKDKKKKKKKNEESYTLFYKTKHYFMKKLDLFFFKLNYIFAFIMPIFVYFNDLLIKLQIVFSPFLYENIYL